MQSAPPRAHRGELARGCPPPEVAEPGLCAELTRVLGGTRAAPACWEELYAATLQGFGFSQRLPSACCFFRRSAVRGDDSTRAGYD
eukprot:12095011-Alexandrium_andersonii.AAC.1